MCGIVGILYRNIKSQNTIAPIGKQLINMLDALGHRGVDSTGVTVIGEPIEEDFIIRLWVDSSINVVDAVNHVEKTLKNLDVDIKHRSITENFIRLTVNYKDDINNLTKNLVALPGIIIHSIGNTSEVIKDVGDAQDLDNKHDISKLIGTHGIGHVRLATESLVDITHSHPFWAFPFPDITMVHNGQLTNYHNMRRLYEQKNHHFQTHNDSELIAVYLADKMDQGLTLEESLKQSLKDLDGAFTYIVSTKNEIGVAKDQWSCKPLVVMETDDIIALASEEVALRQVFPQEIDRIEPQQNQVMTWKI